MAWEDCVKNIKSTLDPKAKEIFDVNWASVDPDALNEDTFASGEPFSLICPNRHCTDNADFSPQAHRICRCEDINGNKISPCEPKDYLYPYPSTVCVDISNVNNFSGKRGKQCSSQGDNYYPLTCQCCCSCFAYGTKIGVPNGTKKIEDFVRDDLVLSAKIFLDVNGMKLEWQTARVSFSQGTGRDSYQASMVYIQHGDTGLIIVTPDHLFLLSSGKLKRADRLVPGKDLLVSAEGTPVVINEVSIGEYKGGVHHIATDKEFSGDLNDHLILSDGVVSGDFNLQIHSAELKDKYFEPEHDLEPKIASAEYEDKHTHLVCGTYKNYKAADAELFTMCSNDHSLKAKKRKFYVHGENQTSIPDSAAQYLSSDQAQDILVNAPMRDFTEMNMGNASIKYILQLFKGFYPEIIFYHDLGRLEPNAYAFSAFDKHVIVLSGGLTRIKNLQIEGLALILSHMVTRLQMSEPHDYNGYTSVGMADYYSTSVLQTVFFEQMYIDVFKKGVKQISENIFAHITNENDAYSNDPFAPTTETRLDALDAGYAMDFPPDGIGGPVFEGLQLLDASAFAPEFQDNSFITEDITADEAAVVFAQLKEQQVLDEEGFLRATFTMDTDLSYLFSDKTENLRNLLIEEVRYILLHMPARIYLNFNRNMAASKGTTATSYQLTPDGTIKSVEAKEDASPEVWLQAVINRDVEYTITVSRYVKAADGSTMDSQMNQAKFTLR